MQDVYNADVAGGWGICTKNGDTQYRIRTNLFVGDSMGADNRRLSATGVSSYFSLLNVDLTVDGAVSNTGVFKIGELIDSVKCITQKPSTLNLTQLDTIIGAHYPCGGSFYVYGSLVYRMSSDVTIIDAVNSTFYNSSSLLTYQWAKTRIARCNLISDGWESGIMLSYPATVKDVTINMIYATRIWVGGALDPIDIEDPKFINCTYVLMVQGSSTTAERVLNYINAETEAWTVFWAIAAMNVVVNRQYSFNLNVMDGFGMPISGAIVTMQNKDGVVVFSGLTDSNGDIPRQIVTTNVYKYASGLNPGTTSDTPKNPFTLSVNKSGYIQQKMQLQIGKKFDGVIKLQPNRGVDLITGCPVHYISDGIYLSI
jgi:hypothetical protein